LTPIGPGRKGRRLYVRGNLIVACVARKEKKEVRAQTSIGPFGSQGGERDEGGKTEEILIGRTVTVDRGACAKGKKVSFVKEGPEKQKIARGKGRRRLA